MATTKIGLKITRSQGGFAFGPGVNEDPFWTRYIRDVREDCRALSHFNAGSSVILFSTNESGNLLGIVYSSLTRPGELVSGWVYLPVNTAISGAELSGILGIVLQELSAETPDIARLNSVFDTEYPVNDVAMTLYKSSGDLIACRFYGEGCRYSLADLLGVEMSQPEYQRFKEIFFIDAASGIKCDRGTDLSDNPMQEYVTVFPPEPVFGFIPYIGNDIFDIPRGFTFGERIRINWKRQGYKTLEKYFDVDPGSPVVPSIGHEEIFKYVTYDSVLVKDEKFCSVDGYTLRVNNKILEKGMMLAVKELMIREVPVSVSCDGFNTFDAVMDLSGPVTVTLEKKTYAYTFILPVTGFEEERIQVVSETPLEKSPVQGYKTEGAPVPNVRNYLEYNPEGSSSGKKTIVAAIIALLVGLLLGWAVSASLSHSSVDRLRAENSALKSRLAGRGGTGLPDSLLSLADSTVATPAPGDFSSDPALTAQARKEAAARKAQRIKEEKAAARAARKAAKIAAREEAKARKEEARRKAAEEKAAKKAAEDSLKAAKAARKAEEKAAKEEAEKKIQAEKEAAEQAARDKEAAEAAAAKQAEAEAAEAARKAAVVKASAKVISYLDSSNKWSRTEMEAFGEINGLWDALNERNFEKILSYSDKLEGSSRFRAICATVSELQKIPGKHFTQNYCVDPSDTEITFMNYQNKIDGKLRDLKGI